MSFERHFPFERVYNFRDLGGYPTADRWAPAGTGRELHGPEDAAAAVRDLAARGATAIKVSLNAEAGPTPSDADIPAVCIMDAGNNGVAILADKMLPPRKHGVMIPGPQNHAAKIAFEIAGTAGGKEGSPRPVGVKSVLRNLTSIDAGAFLIRVGWYWLKLVCTTRPCSIVISHANM